MAHELYFPPCVLDPPHPLHPPPFDKPIRICAGGPLSAIEKLLPDLTWNLQLNSKIEFQQCALLLATFVYRTIYGREPVTEDGLRVRCETIGYLNPAFPEEYVYLDRRYYRSINI
jgi:hypothetical protein